MANDPLVIAQPVGEPVTASPFAARPAAHWFVRRYHQAFLWLTVLGLLSLMMLEVGPGGLVRIRLFDVTLRGMCAWQFFTGFDCPLCGLTRCFVSMGNLNPVAAFRYNPVGVGLFVLVVAQIPYRSFQLKRISQGRGEFYHKSLIGVVWLMAAAFAVQWIVKIVQFFSA